MIPFVSRAEEEDDDQDRPGRLTSRSLVRAVVGYVVRILLVQTVVEAGERRRVSGQREDH